MLLSIDIGNSTIGLGRYTGRIENSRLRIKKIPSSLFKSAEKFRQEVSALIKTGRNVSPMASGMDAIISSVVPSLDHHVIQALTSLCKKKPLVVSSKLDIGLVFKMPHPEKIGADRIANAVAGYNYTKRPVAVIDFGTATTITVVGRKHDLIGGAILPGLELMQKSLHSGTAKLPAVRPVRPRTVLGKNTLSSIASGIVYGTAGAVEALIKGMEKELGFRLKLVLTGGHAALMSSLMGREHLLKPDLIFEGLKLIYLKNR